MSAALLVVSLAWRSVIAHRIKSLVIGSLLLVGTYVVVLGNALLDSVEDAMQDLIVDSLAGSFQVKERDTRDQLSLFGQFGLGSTDIGDIPAFEEVEARLLAVDGVQSVLPMGVTNATVFGRNEIDEALTQTRDALREGRLDDARRLALRVRRVTESIASESEAYEAIADPERLARTRETLAEVMEPSFWRPFELTPSDDPAQDPVAAALRTLDTLDSRVAPLASDGRLLYLRVVGTDPQQFVEVAPRFRLVQGQVIPPGRPGFLFNESTYQELVKNRVAAELDRLRKGYERDGDRIADDPLLQQRVRRLAGQQRRVTFQLDPDEAVALEQELRAFLGSDGGSPSGDLDALVATFLTVDDSTLLARHDWFYAHIAPLIPLYDVPVGGTITLRGFTQSGYVRAVEVPVYGTFLFDGLQDAGLESGANLVDLATFRELYGKMSERDKGELADIKARVGVQEVARADAEAALFGGGGEVEAAVTGTGGVQVDIAGVRAVDPWQRTFPPEDLRRGLVLDAAVRLTDPSRADALRPALEAAAAELGLEVLDWKEASGLLGQIVTVLRLVLLVAAGIIFLVALILVNNAMVMATVDRVPEIGTLRAIGAPRSAVVGLFLLETALLAVTFGGLGAAGAAGTVAWLGQVGIPAPARQLVVLFGGPRLYPTIGADDLAFGLVTVTLVAVASTAWPATMASRVQPIVAMRGGR